MAILSYRSYRAIGLGLQTRCFCENRPRSAVPVAYSTDLVTTTAKSR